MNIIKRLEEKLHGVKYERLNLNEFIRHFDLELILNNCIYPNNVEKFEIYNYDELYESEKEYIKENLSDYFEEEEIKEMTEEELEDEIEEKADENIYMEAVYQYFIIPNRDVELWEKYTNYIIFYDEENDLYLLGIGHWGMSWNYFETDYYNEIITDEKTYFKHKYGI